MKERLEKRSFYKKRMYGKRTMIARGADFITLRIVIAFAAFFCFKTLMPTVASAVLAVVAVLMFSTASELIKSVRLDRFIASERDRMVREHIKQIILYLDNDSFCRLAGRCVDDDGCVTALQKISPITPDDVLAAYRQAAASSKKAAHIVTIAQITPEARVTAQSAPSIKIHFHTSDELIELYNDECIDADELEKIAIMAEKNKRRLRGLKGMRPFAPSRARSYIIASSLLMVLSFFVKHALYFRIMGIICMVFGMLTACIGVYTKKSA